MQPLRDRGADQSQQMPPTPPSAGPPTLENPAALRFAADALPWQRSLRWTRARLDPRRLWPALLLATLVTVIELAGFAVGMRSYRHAPADRAVIRVELIEPPQELPPPPPEPEPPEFVRRPSRIAIEPPKVRTTPPPAAPQSTDEQMNARIGAAGGPQLFNPDGSIRLGGAQAPVAAPAAPANPREAAKARWAEIEKRGNPLDCRKTRFAGAFKPDENAGDGVARKYLKWIGLADGEAIAHRQRQRAESGGCE